MRHHRSVPPRTEAELEAWRLVIDAIEEAIDVEGLHVYDRSTLSTLHDYAEVHAGIPVFDLDELCVGAPLATMPAMSHGPLPKTPGPERSRAYELARADAAASGGIDWLPIAWDRGSARTLYHVLREEGLTRIADVELVRQEHGLESIPGVGPMFAKQLADALNRYHRDQ